MRTIDADEYKQRLIKESECYCVCETEEDIGAFRAYGDAIDELDKMPTVGEWIPCDKKLPKESGTYLVTIQYGENKIQQVEKFSDDLYHVDEYDFDEYKNKKHCGWYDYDSEWGFCEIDNVIAWMPLPEPFKEI